MRASHRAPMARHWRMEQGPNQGTVNQPINKIITVGGEGTGEVIRSLSVARLVADSPTEDCS
jgi:hypothetical protein